MASSKSPREEQLLSLSKTFDSAFVHRNLSSLDKLFSKDITVHADQVTLLNDIKGRRAALLWFQAYFDKYDFEHQNIFGSVNDHENATFSVTVDKGVKPCGDAHKEQQEKGQVQPTDTISLKMLQWNKQDELTDIWELRQLSHDEAQRKLKEVPDISKLSLNLDSLRGTPDEIEPTGDRRSLHELNAAKWNQVFFGKAPELVDEIVADKAKMYNIVMGSEHTGKDEIKTTVKKILSGWEVKDTHSILGATAGNKAFSWWQVTGVDESGWTTIYGLSVLVFNKQGKIQEIVSARQVVPQERKQLLKA
jgi:hypothetical protein